jgi:putative aldouronate transport system substrate-binding protein
MKKRIAAFLLAGAVCVSFSACSQSAPGNSKADGGADLSKYPIQTDAELTYWVELSGNVSATKTSFGDTPFAKKLAEETGVKIKYIHPAAGQAAEAFSLMLASNELPDMVEYNWAGSAGGPAAAINDGVILPLNDAFKDYAPNLSAYLKENPAVDKSIKTDDGQYYVFPFIRSDKSLLISKGPVVRADWLNELGLEPPATAPEWEEMLRRFRDEKGAAAPLTLLKHETRFLFLLNGSNPDLYVEDGKVKFGACEPDYLSALTTLRRWFETGLLDKNYVSVDGTIQDSNILNGKSGATFASGGSGLGKWLDTMKTKGTGFDLVGAKFPGADKNTNSRFIPITANYSTYGSVAITALCKNVPLAARFLDWSYSEAGGVLNNFGVEGESFTYMDGYPKYTPLITDNPDKLTMSQAMGLYLRANASGAFIQDKRYIEQYYATPQQRQALDNWLLGYDESAATLLPNVTLTETESSEYTNIYNEVLKYRDATTANFISGVEPLSSFDDYIDNLKKLKIDRMLEIQQAAYERFIKR